RIRAVQSDDEGSLRLLRLELPEVEEQERFDPRVLVEAAVPDVPVRLLVADPERRRPDQGRKGRRRGGRARHLCLTDVHVDLDRCHRTEKLPPLADIRRLFYRLPTLREGAIQIYEEVVVERFCGQRGHSQAAAVVVERGVDDELRGIAGLRPRGEIL